MSTRILDERKNRNVDVESRVMYIYNNYILKEIAIPNSTSLDKIPVPNLYA